jgi:hypothetical protein
VRGAPIRAARRCWSTHRAGGHGREHPVGATRGRVPRMGVRRAPRTGQWSVCGALGGTAAEVQLVTATSQVTTPAHTDCESVGLAFEGRELPDRERHRVVRRAGRVPGTGAPDAVALDLGVADRRGARPGRRHPCGGHRRSLLRQPRRADRGDTTPYLHRGPCPRRGAAALERLPRPVRAVQRGLGKIHSDTTSHSRNGSRTPIDPVAGRTVEAGAGVPHAMPPKERGLTHRPTTRGGLQGSAEEVMRRSSRRLPREADPGARSAGRTR